MVLNDVASGRETGKTFLVSAMPALGAIYMKPPGRGQLTIGAFAVMFAAGSVALVQELIYDKTVFPMVGMQLLLGVIAWIIWSRLGRFTE